MRKPLSVLAVFLCLSVCFSYAQEQTGEIFGKVTDKEKVPLPGVSIEAKSPSLVGLETSATDENGRYRLLSLDPGAYTITFSLPGFQILRRQGILVRVGKTLNLDAVLNQAAIKEEVVVSGEAPIVDVKKSATAVNIDKATFSRIPRGRDFTSVVSLTTPGANDEPLSGGISIDGSSGAENVFFIDGVDSTSMLYGTSDQSVIFEFIEEIQIKSNGYSAEFGGSMGGVVNVITRSGGNTFQGEASLYLRSNKLQGQPRPTLRLKPYNNTQAEYITYPEDDWNRYEFGFGLGGYILKDKLWFYGSFIPQYTETTRTVEFIPSGLEQTHIRKETTYFAQAKLTAQPFHGLRISGSFVTDYYKWNGVLPDLDGTNHPDYAYASQRYAYPSVTSSARADYILTNDLFFNLSVGYFRRNVKQDIDRPDEPRYLFGRSNASIPGVDPSLVRPSGWRNLPRGTTSKVDRDIQSKLTANFDGTYFFNAGGQHVAKAGIQMVRVGHDISNLNTVDLYTFHWGRDLWSPFGMIPTTYGYLAVFDPIGYLADIRSLRLALYIQDSWTINDRLTLNYGLRMEKEELPSYSTREEYQSPPIKFSFADKLAPRIGFAYDVFGDSSLKLFGSFGIYYDVMKLKIGIEAYGGVRNVFHYYDMKTLDWTQFPNTDHPDTTRPDLYEHIVEVDQVNVLFDNTQPDMHPFNKVEYTAGLEKKLGEDISLSARFLHSRIIWAVEDMGLEGLGEFYVGNPGSEWIAQIYRDKLNPDVPSPPKAKRNYYSLSIGLDKRFSHRWMGGVHYTWSYLWGNYSGLADSDTHANIQPWPNYEYSFDYWFLNRDQNMNETTGKLRTDRPHFLKVYGSYSFDFGLTIGLYSFVSSGIPLSRRMQIWWKPTYYPVGRKSDGRTPMLNRTDLYLEYNLRLGGKNRLQLNANISNMFNQKIVQAKWEIYNQQNVFLTTEEILAGFDYQDVVKNQGVDLDPRFMMPFKYQSPIDVRLGIKFIF